MDAKPAPRRRPRGAATVERQLLDEVLALKDQVHLLATNIEHQTNAIGQTQVLVQRDVATLATRVDTLITWKAELDQERAEQRGAARVRKSLLAIVAGIAGLLGSGVGVLINHWLKGGA